MFSFRIALFACEIGKNNEFDRDIFTKLVDTIIVKDRDNIMFVMKDGREMNKH